MDKKLTCLERELQRAIPVRFTAGRGADALEFVAARRGDGNTHLIAGSNEEVFQLFDQFAFSQTSTEEILAAARKTDGGAWLDETFRTATVYAFEGMGPGAMLRSEEHTSELQSLMRISYAVFCLKKKNRRTVE